MIGTFRSAFLFHVPIPFTLFIIWINYTNLQYELSMKCFVLAALFACALILTELRTQPAPVQSRFSVLEEVCCPVLKLKNRVSQLLIMNAWFQ